MVAVVTKNTITVIADDVGESINNAARLVVQLGFGAGTYPELKDMLYGSENSYGDFKASGIRADHLQRLERMLRNKELELRNLGARSVKLLTLVCQQVFPEPQSESPD